MDDENEVPESENSQNQGMVKKGADAAANKAKQAVTDAAKKGAKKAVGGQAGLKGQVKRKILTALFPVPGIYIIIAIVAIIVIVGIVMFFVSVPAMFTGKLKEIVKTVANAIAAYFGADTTQMVDDVEIYEALDYLKESGYALKGDGFLTDYYDENHTNVSGEANSDKWERATENQDKEIYYDSSDGGGIWRYREDNKIAVADSDFVFEYIVSDNYCYTIANHNIVTQDNKAEGIWGSIDNFFRAIGAGFAKFENFFFGPVFDALGITEAAVDTWGTGLIAIYYDTGEIGISKGIVNDSSIWSGAAIDIDPDANTMTLKRTAFLNSNRAVEFSLDGWTGRYGMPLEFLVAVHKATGMPDLAYDMATSFNTRVNIYLHSNDSGDVDVAIKTDNGYVSVQEAASLVSNYNFYGYGGDDLVAKGLATKSEDENGNASYTLIDNLETAIGIGENNVDPDYLCFIPYIAYVSDHWYRDVYFVSQDKDGNKINPSSFVDLDYNYEDLSYERWTVYKTDENDNFMWYILDENGNFTTSTPTMGDGKNLKTDSNGYYYFDGTRDEAIKSGYAVSKMAITLGDSGSNINTVLEDLGWEESTEGSGNWTAYHLNSDDESNDYEPLFKEGENNSAAASMLYVKVTIAGNVNQKGEGQRLQTNSEIKKMFLENTYFKYDGSEVTAEAITRLRKENEVALSTAHAKYVNGVKTDNDSIYGPVGEYDANGKYKYYLTATASEDSINTKVEDLDFEYNNTKYKITADAANTDVDDDVEVIKLEDLVGKVELNSESLSAFSILENMHTLDADYIYRDFKELIVELGYFTKEELTEDIEEQMEFPIPDIGCADYPNESIDKNENEMGTMIHSKGDIDADTAITNNELCLEIGEEEEDIDRVKVESDEAYVDTKSNIVQDDSDTLMLADSKGTLSATMQNNALMAVGDGDYDLGDFGYSDGSIDVSSVSVEDFLAKAREMCEYINEVGYDYCATHCDHAVHNNPHGLPTTFIDSTKSTSVHNMCCATLVSWALQNVGVMPDSAHLDEQSSLAQWVLDNLDSEKVTDGSVEPGDLFVYDGHIDLCGEEIDTGYVKYNGGHYAMIGAVEDGEHSSIQHISGLPSSSGDPPYMFSVRIHWGDSQDPQKYIGFYGNEAVVSPVTGVLLDYGVYDDEPDAVSGIINRKNVDYVISTDDQGNRTFSTKIDTLQNDNDEDTYTHDKVGYAIIKVLDSNELKKFATSCACTIDKFNFGDIVSTTTNSAGETNTIYKDYFDGCATEEAVKEKAKLLSKDDYSDVATTIEGYKEFVERYDSAGISGYTVLVDGFCPELPDPNFDPKKDYKKENFPNSSRDESEYKLSLDSYKEITFDGGKLDEGDCILTNEYGAEDANKMASKAATAIAKYERGYMGSAANSIFYDNSKIIIKEGTVLGRTYTDREFIKEFRTDSTYEKLRPTFQDGYKPEYDDETGELTNGDTIIGNYIRVKMTNTESEEVEDVYNYMKLQEVEVKVDCDWILFYFLPFESGAAEPVYNGSYWSGVSCEWHCSEGETGVGLVQWTSLTSDGLCNQRDQLWPYYEENYPEIYNALKQFANWGPSEWFADQATGVQTYSKAANNVFKEIGDEFIQAQMDAAKENYLKPLLESYPWLENKHQAAQAEIMHLYLWGPAVVLDASDQINESMSDKDLILYARHKIATTSSTAGEASNDETRDRPWNEPEIGLHIIDGSLNEDDIEEFVRHANFTYLEEKGVEFRW